MVPLLIGQPNAPVTFSLIAIDLAGKLTSTADRNGNAPNIAYDGFGQIATVTESGARVMLSW